MDFVGFESIFNTSIRLMGFLGCFDFWTIGPGRPFVASDIFWQVSSKHLTSTLAGQVQRLLSEQDQLFNGWIEHPNLEHFENHALALWEFETAMGHLITRGQLSSNLLQSYHGVLIAIGMWAYHAIVSNMRRIRSSLLLKSWKSKSPTRPFVSKVCFVFVQHLVNKQISRPTMSSLAHRSLFSSHPVDTLW